MNHKVCRDIFDLADVINHNTEIFVKRITKANRKAGFAMVGGIIFGIYTQVRFAEQEAKIVELSRQIKELRDEKGD